MGSAHGLRIVALIALVLGCVAQVPALILVAGPTHPRAGFLIGAVELSGALVAAVALCVLRFRRATGRTSAALTIVGIVLIVASIRFGHLVSFDRFDTVAAVAVRLPTPQTMVEALVVLLGGTGEVLLVRGLVGLVGRAVHRLRARRA